MANQENTKELTGHLDDVIIRIAQARAVLSSLSQNCAKDNNGEIHFGDLMTFEDVCNTFWVVSDLLDQALGHCDDGFKAACGRLHHG